MRRTSKETQATMNKVYAGLVFSQLFTLIAYVVVSAGAGMLQNKLDTAIRNGLKDTSTAADTQDALTSVLASARMNVYNPSDKLSFVLQYQWWIIQVELVLFLFTALLTIKPSFIARARPVALTFLASALSLVMDNTNSLSKLNRDDNAKFYLDDYRINTAYGGLVLVFCANVLTIICLGLYKDDKAAVAGA